MDGRRDKYVRKLLRQPATVTRRMITEPRKYARLAKRHRWENADGTIWPISTDNLLQYIAFSHRRGNQPATISTYLSTLARFHTYKGFFHWRQEVRAHPMIMTAVHKGQPSFSSGKAEMLYNDENARTD